MRSKRPPARCLAALLALAALLPGPALAASHGLTSLTVGIVAEERMVLSPLTVRERDPLNILALCYEGLVSLNDDEYPEPCLAESWDAPQGNSDRWIFHLRPGVTFHNGKPLTANDVCATLDYIFQLGGYDADRKSELPVEERGVWGNLIAYVSSWQAIDEATVQITATRRYFGLLNAMTFPILPAEEVANAMPAGTGPYRIEEYEPGERIWLSASSTWWKPAPAVANIVAYIYRDLDDVLNAFDLGQVDMAATRSMSATRYSGSMRSFSMNYRTRQLEVLLMQHTGLLAQEYLRRAIMCAIDRSRLVRQVYQDMATPVNTPIAPGTWLYDESATQEEYDPAQARALLEQNGWLLGSDGKRSKSVDGVPTELSLRLFTYEEPGNSVRRSAAATIQEMLGEVGITCRLSSLSYSDTKLRLEKGGFDLVLGAINLDVVPDPGFMLMSGYATNYCRYNSENMTKLIKSMRIAVSDEAYRAAMREVQHQFVMDAPFMCLYFRNGALLTRQTFTDARSLREMELLRGIEVW
ncbi:MAG: peptide ABC transporter substrate-binding protein [Oscillospiraceae bacterium]|nr:peptide ABC transporter substrate-binding protein [Oscillospiraceae bacterium]